MIASPTDGLRLAHAEVTERDPFAHSTRFDEDTMNKNIRTLARDTEGLSTVEYVIILMLIAVVGIVAWRTFGNTVVGKINAGNSQVSGLGGA